MKIDLSDRFSLAAGHNREMIGKRVDLAVQKKDESPEKHKAQTTEVAPISPVRIVMDDSQVRLRFEVDKETGVRVIQVVDADSGKLVRQIPPEEILNVTKALRDLKGLFVSKES